ncbi:MAG TPA: class I SAM-dependent methyltransferase, partial [Acidimicrobiales bacterium]|nr:class I SAM-dependent methyltransferase [Acidimicrobiales bacterium]
MATLSAMPVDPSNADQLRTWDGDEGAFWAEHHEHFDRSIAAHHGPLMACADVGVSDRVLDVGCGTGQVARDAARSATSGSVLGVDLSSPMLDVARRIAAAEGLTNVRFEQADAQVHAFEQESFDVAVSRTAAMFFGDKRAAFANIARALRPGGRLVMVTWQPPPQNEWILEFSGAMAAGRDLSPPPPDAPGPFSLSDPAAINDLLEANQFRDVNVEGVVAPMWFGSTRDEAFDLVFGLLWWMLEGLDNTGRTSA